MWPIGSGTGREFSQLFYDRFNVIDAHDPGSDVDLHGHGRRREKKEDGRSCGRMAGSREGYEGGRGIRTTLIIGQVLWFMDGTLWYPKRDNPPNDFRS